jgi:hypothetical protein
MSIGVAINHLQCLFQSAVFRPDDSTVTYVQTRHYAYFALLRGALENGATAIWLLARKTRAERVGRRM